jgi:hypothetical protein
LLWLIAFFGYPCLTVASILGASSARDLSETLRLPFWTAWLAVWLAAGAASIVPVMIIEFWLDGPKYRPGTEADYVQIMRIEISILIVGLGFGLLCGVCYQLLGRIGFSVRRENAQ